MSHTIYFVSHPDVEISVSIPVTQWPLSEIGRARMKHLLLHPWVNNVTAIYCSAEQKAIDGAGILADHLNLDYETNSALGENDRSATGYLETTEFEQTADKFVSSPEQSVKGWETALAAQVRIVNAVRDIDRNDHTERDIAIVSHGAVGTLLYCAVADKPISRHWDQPGQGGGNFMKLRLSPTMQCTWWESID